MLLSAITLVLLLAPQPINADSTESRQIAAPCKLVGDKAIQYLGDHDFFASRKMALGKIVDDFVIEFVNRKHASTPSGTPLSLNRSSINKYARPRHLSPLKAYTNFQADGEIKLTETSEGSCNVTLRFKISAFEYVWAPVMDDGYRSQFISNGVLERLYIDALVDVLKP